MGLRFKTLLSGKFKIWCLQYGLYPRLQLPLMMYELGASRVERVEQNYSVYIRRWLKLQKKKKKKKSKTLRHTVRNSNLTNSIDFCRV